MIVLVLIMAAAVYGAAATLAVGYAYRKVLPTIERPSTGYSSDPERQARRDARNAAYFIGGFWPVGLFFMASMLRVHRVDQRVEQERHRERELEKWRKDAFDELGG